MTALHNAYISVAQLYLTVSTPWTIACQDPLSMDFSRQEYWSGLPCSSPGDLPDPETEPTSLTSPVVGHDLATKQ